MNFYNKPVKNLCALPTAMKATIAFFVVNMIQKGMVFLTSPIYTRLLTPDEYGKTAVFTSWTTLLGIICMYCLSYGVYNVGLMEHKDRRDGYTASMLLLSGIITSICFAVTVLFMPQMRLFLGLDVPLILLMFLIFFTQPAFNFWSTRERFEYKYKLLLFTTAATSVFAPIVSIICITLFPNYRIYGKLFGTESVMILFYLIIYIYLIKRGRKGISSVYWKQALLFNTPLIPHYLSRYILNHSDQLMISHFVGDSAAAKYTVAYYISSVVLLFWSAIDATLLPFIYNKAETKDYTAIKRVVTPLIAVAAMICTLASLVAPELLAIMAPNSYSDSLYVIPIVTCGVFFNCMYSVFIHIVYYHKQPKYAMAASVAAAIVNLGLNWIFIPRFGYMAAGYTTLTAYILQAIIDFYAMRKVVGHNVYNVKFLCMLGLGVVIISLNTGFLYEHTILRYGLLGALLIGMFLKRQYILSLLPNKSYKKLNHLQEDL